MKDPEILDNDSNILLFTLRDRATRTYSDIREGRFVGKTIADLKTFILTTVFNDVAGELDIEIAKHIPHEYAWKWINQAEVIEQTSGKKNN